MERRRDHAGMNFIADALEIIHAQDRTRWLRDRVLQGDAKAAALLRKYFHLTYWEYRGQTVLPQEAHEAGARTQG